MSLVSNENGILPADVTAAIGSGITGILEITNASEVEEMLTNAADQDDNPNMSAIVTAVHEGHMEPSQPIVLSRPLAGFYSENKELVAD
jgi:hypothetical protein